MIPEKRELLIIYNADGGMFNMVADAVHKLVSPGTYPCSLCALTYGPVAMRGTWRDFLTTLPFPTRFHHKDDFAAAWPGLAIALPAILLREGEGQPALLVSAPELDALESIDQLIELTRDRLAQTA